MRSERKKKRQQGVATKLDMRMEGVGAVGSEAAAGPAEELGIKTGVAYWRTQEEE